MAGSARRRQARHTAGTVRAALVASYRDGCLGTSKGAAYSGLLAFFPLLATIASILVRFRADFVAQQISNFLAEILPPGTHRLVFYYFTVKGRQPFLLPVTGALLSIWAASGALVSLMEGFRVAYRIPSGRPFVKQRIVALVLVVSAAIPVLAASALLLFGVPVERAIVHALGLLPAGVVELRGWVLVLGTLIRLLIALGAIILGATMLYYFGPNRKQRWVRVWPGAVAATLLWFAATLFFAWYVRHIANYNVIYGSITAVILLLVWMYVLAVIALFGCEFNAARERLSG
jgi:membrane protein